MDKHDKAKDVKAPVKPFGSPATDEIAVDAALVVEKPALLYREYLN